MGEAEFVERQAGEGGGPPHCAPEASYNAQLGTPGALTPGSGHDKIKAASEAHGGDDWNDL